jgi:hypothetical protein
MEVCYPGGDVPQKTMCLKLNLFKGGGVGYTVNLIVFESKGIYVILGTDWLSQHKGLRDNVKRVVKLTTNDRKKLEYAKELQVTR